jgi:hypothetical protein
VNDTDGLAPRPPVQLSLVLPCYREAEHIDVSVPRILRVLADLPYQTEILFVDDRSPDDTAARIERLCRQYAHWPMRLIRHERNQGRGAAVMTGIRAAQGRWVGFVDIDLEVAPDYIAVCCRILDEGWDVCIGSRHYPATLNSLARFLASSLYRRLAWSILGLPQIDSESGYKFFVRERILPVLEQTTNRGWFWDTQIVAESYLAGLRVAQTPCLHLRRMDKTSTVRLVRDSVEFLGELVRYRAALARRLPARPAVAVPETVRPTAALTGQTGNGRYPWAPPADRALDTIDGSGREASVLDPHVDNGALVGARVPSIAADPSPTWSARPRAQETP